MGGEAAERERRLLNRVTTVKLALQILERKTRLSPAQRALVRLATEAIDGLTLDLTAERSDSPVLTEQLGRFLASLDRADDPEP